MIMSDKIDKQKSILIDIAINDYKLKNRGLSTAFKLMANEIEQMRNDGLSLKLQVEILSGILDVEIKYDTYKKWSQRNFKSIKKTAKVVKSDVKKVIAPVMKKSKIVAPEKEPESIEDIFNSTIKTKSNLADFA